MTQEIVDVIKNKIITLSQQIAAMQSNEDEIFIYNDEGLENIFIDYKNMKEKIKEIITRDDFLADRHKIAAFFISAIIKNEPIAIKLNKTDLKDSDLKFTINLNLAVAVANYIIVSFYKTRNKIELKIASPKAGTNNYNDQLFALIRMIRDTMHQSDNKEMLLLTISHILFLIEKCSECNNSTLQNQ